MLCTEMVSCTVNYCDSVCENVWLTNRPFHLWSHFLLFVNYLRQLCRAEAPRVVWLSRKTARAWETVRFMLNQWDPKSENEIYLLSRFAMPLAQCMLDDGFHCWLSKMFLRWCMTDHFLFKCFPCCAKHVSKVHCWNAGVLERMINSRSASIHKLQSSTTYWA